MKDPFELMKAESLAFNAKSYKKLYEFIDEATGETVSVGSGSVDVSILTEGLKKIVKKYKKRLINKKIKYYKDEKAKKVIFFVIKDVVVEYSDRYKYPYITFYTSRISSGFRLRTYLDKRLLVHGVYSFTSNEEITKITGWVYVPPFSQTNSNLYIIRNEIGRIKIGRSINVEQRLKNLSNSAGLEMHVIREITGGGYLESKLHYYFKRCRHIGEWFNMTELEVRFLLEEDLELFFRCYTNKK